MIRVYPLEIVFRSALREASKVWTRMYCIQGKNIRPTILHSVLCVYFKTNLRIPVENEQGFCGDAKQISPQLSHSLQIWGTSLFMKWTIKRQGCLFIAYFREWPKQDRQAFLLLCDLLYFRGLLHLRGLFNLGGLLRLVSWNETMLNNTTTCQHSF